MRVLDGNQIPPLAQGTEILFQFLCGVLGEVGIGAKQSQQLLLVQADVCFLGFQIEDPHNRAISGCVRCCEVTCLRNIAQCNCSELHGVHRPFCKNQG